jgi:hypothetical protein
MKIYVICFDNKIIKYPKAFADKALAEERLKELQDTLDAEADEFQWKSYSHWYSVDEMEVEERPGQT